MDDVRVHYGSPKPAALGALAFAQGNDIHLAPGQEQHLPHEAWHVVQQKQGRVKPTLQAKGMPINDDRGLEREADAFGEKAGKLGAGGPARSGHLAPASAPFRRGAARPGTIQAKIRFRNKQPDWEKDTILPKGVSEGHVAHVLSAETYLAQNPADILKRSEGKPAPLLTPHRHLIGEKHNQSKFAIIMRNWGWGAEMMDETFQQSKLVPSKVTEKYTAKSVGLVDNPYSGAKPLDNLHPFVLTSLATLRLALEDLKILSRKSASYAVAVPADKGKANEESFALSEQGADGRRGYVSSEWSELSGHADSYREACAKAPKGPLAGLHAAMNGKWATIPDRIKAIAARPYSFYNGWPATSAALEAVMGKIDVFIRDIVDPWAGELIKLTALEARDLPPLDEKQAALDESMVGEAWNTAVTGKQSFVQDRLTAAQVAMSPVRERFMAANINSNLKSVPAIVCIGEEHVKGLAGKIAKGKLFLTAAAFEDDLFSIPEKPKVLARDEKSEVAPQAPAPKLLVPASSESASSSPQPAPKTDSVAAPKKET
jgi:hypothetical protein